MAVNPASAPGICATHTLSDRRQPALAPPAPRRAAQAPDTGTPAKAVDRCTTILRCEEAGSRGTQRAAKALAGAAAWGAEALMLADSCRRRAFSVLWPKQYLKGRDQATGGAAQPAPSCRSTTTSSNQCMTADQKQTIRMNDIRRCRGRAPVAFRLDCMLGMLAIASMAGSRRGCKARALELLQSRPESGIGTLTRLVMPPLAFAPR